MNEAYLKEAQRAFTCARRAKGYVWKAYYATMSWEALLAMVWEGS